MPYNYYGKWQRQEEIADDIIDIQDLRTSKRIDFLGGLIGLGELKKRVDSVEMKVA